MVGVVLQDSVETGAMEFCGLHFRKIAFKVKLPPSPKCLLKPGMWGVLVAAAAGVALTVKRSST